MGNFENKMRKLRVLLLLGTFAQAEYCFVCTSTKKTVKDDFNGNERPSITSDLDDCWRLRSSNQKQTFCSLGCYHLFYAYRLTGVGQDRLNVEYSVVERGCKY